MKKNCKIKVNKKTEEDVYYSIFISHIPNVDSLVYSIDIEYKYI